MTMLQSEIGDDDQKWWSQTQSIWRFLSITKDIGDKSLLQLAQSTLYCKGDIGWELNCPISDSRKTTSPLSQTTRWLSMIRRISPAYTSSSDQMKLLIGVPCFLQTFQADQTFVANFIMSKWKTSKPTVQIHSLMWESRYLEAELKLYF